MSAPLAPGAVDSADLPVTDWRSTKAHTADQCQFELCEFCGCCAHGKAQAKGCRVDDVPRGFRCPNDLCGCEGRA